MNIFGKCWFFVVVNTISKCGHLFWDICNTLLEHEKMTCQNLNSSFEIRKWTFFFQSRNVILKLNFRSEKKIVQSKYLIKMILTLCKQLLQNYLSIGRLNELSIDRRIETLFSRWFSDPFPEGKQRKINSRTFIYLQSSIYQMHWCYSVSSFVELFVMLVFVDFPLVEE